MAERYVGLISGTSMDGVDAVLINQEHDRPLAEAALTAPFSRRLFDQLDLLRSDPDRFPVGELARLDAELADAFAAAALAVISQAGLEPASVKAVGCHGQTVLHRPEGSHPHTLQIGDPWRVAAGTGLPVVADFRRSDLAAGGQGAPLAPLLHQALFQSNEEDRLVANLGGIANLTILPAGGGIAGFDTGPANCFLDLWYRRHQPGRYDPAGAWAASGVVNPDLLASLVDDPYFAKPPPKSTGIEHFNPQWLADRLQSHRDVSAVDVQATLAEASALTLARSIRILEDVRPARLIVCGGGIHNLDLLARLEKHLPGMTVESSALHGLHPDHVEGALFAWLARQRLAGVAINTGPVTGARRPVLLGTVFSFPAP